MFFHDVECVTGGCRTNIATPATTGVLANITLNNIADKVFFEYFQNIVSKRSASTK